VLSDVFLRNTLQSLSTLAPYNSLQIPYISIQYPKMSDMYMLKEKQRCLVRSLVRDFSRQNGRKIQVKPKCRLQREIANLISRHTYRCTVYILPAHPSVQTFWSVYYSLPSYLRNFPIEDVQYYYSRQQNLVKKPDLILNGGIFTNILMLQDNVVV
jgi:hypothetical protein